MTFPNQDSSFAPACRIVVLVGILLTAACAVRTPPLSESDSALVETLGFDAAGMTRVRGQGESFERLQGLSEDYRQYPADGMILFVKPNRGRAVLGRIRGLLEDSDYSAYLYEQAFGFGPDEIAIVRGDNALTFLTTVGTNGVNYNVMREDVLARYKVWDNKYGLNLQGAGLDWLEATFDNPPDDWLVFAKEVYRFCPDVVDQGAGDVGALALELRKGNGVYLWWD